MQTSTEGWKIKEKKRETFKSEKLKQKQHIIQSVNTGPPLVTEPHLLEEQIAEGLRKLAVLHQQEVAQRLKVPFHPQLHEKVVHHGLVHQRDAEDGKEEEWLDTGIGTKDVAPPNNMKLTLHSISWIFEFYAWRLLRGTAALWGFVVFLCAVTIKDLLI